MNTKLFTPGSSGNAVLITRVAERHWHALDDDRVVGREAKPRPARRADLSSASTPGTARSSTGSPRRCWPPCRPPSTPLSTRPTATSPRTGGRPVSPTGVANGSTSCPPTVRADATPGGRDDRARSARRTSGRLRELDRAIRAEVEARVGWQSMPAEVLPRPAGRHHRRPVEVLGRRRGRPLCGLVRVTAGCGITRIGLIAVRVGQQRRGIGKALLTMRWDGCTAGEPRRASADVHEANERPPRCSRASAPGG